jgi:hypothetical protein
MASATPPPKWEDCFLKSVVTAHKDIKAAAELFYAGSCLPGAAVRRCLSLRHTQRDPLDSLSSRHDDIAGEHSVRD